MYLCTSVNEEGGYGEGTDSEETSCVYYESIKRKLNKRLIYECRCDERIKVKAEGSTLLTHTGHRVFGLERIERVCRDIP